MLTYKRYGNTNYIVLSDGTVARLLKPCKKGNIEYINFTISKKQKTVNKQALLKNFTESNGDVIEVNDVSQD